MVGFFKWESSFGSNWKLCVLTTRDKFVVGACSFSPERTAHAGVRVEPAAVVRSIEIHGPAAEPALTASYTQIGSGQEVLSAGTDGVHATERRWNRHRSELERRTTSAKIQGALGHV